MKLSTLSSKGQITIPAHLLATLHIKPGSKLLIDRYEGILIIKPIHISMTQELAGSLTSYVDSSKLGKSFTEIMAETKRAVAKKLAKNL